MAHSKAPKLKTPDDSTIQLPESFAGMSVPLMTGGGTLMLLTWIIGLFIGGESAPQLGMSIYLTAYMYVLTISLGALFFVIIQHLCRAGWSVVVRRIAELLMSVMPMLAILFLPILIASYIDGSLYDFYPERADVPASVWAAKSFYFHPLFFTLRTVVYFTVWILLSRYFYQASRTQDDTSSIALTEGMQKYSGPAVVLFALTVSGAAFDWLMSLDPMWFSTMFGVYLFAGSALACFAAITVFVYTMQVCGKLNEEVTIEHYHDLAKFMFGFIFFWTYIAFSQYMLIWYGNIPEETVWYYEREQGGWVWAGIGLVLFHWILPFCALMARSLRRTPVYVFGWAIWILAMHLLDITYIVMPSAYEDAATGPVHILLLVLCTLGMIGLYVGMILRKATGIPLIPARDPRLSESLAFENV